MTLPCHAMIYFLDLCGQLTCDMSILTVLVQNPCWAAMSLCVLEPRLGSSTVRIPGGESMSSSPGSKRNISNAGPH